MLCKIDCRWAPCRAPLVTTLEPKTGVSLVPCRCHAGRFPWCALMDPDQRQTHLVRLAIDVCRARAYVPRWGHAAGFTWCGSTGPGQRSTHTVSLAVDFRRQRDRPGVNASCLPLFPAVSFCFRMFIGGDGSASLLERERLPSQHVSQGEGTRWLPTQLWRNHVKLKKYDTRHLITRQVIGDRSSTIPPR